MHLKLNYWLPSLLLTFSMEATAFVPAFSAPNAPKQQNREIETLITYLQNLGQYFGYDLTQYCQSGSSCGPSGPSGSSGGQGAQFSNALIDENATYLQQLNLFNSYLGALMGGGESRGNSATANPLVPSDTQNYSLVNTLGGQTFSNPAFSSPSESTFSASPLIDQEVSGSYLPDPVSQAVLNIISTPNSSYCPPTEDNNAQKCQLLYKEKIMSNVIGNLQGGMDVFTAGKNIALIPQLNSDTLLAPLLYSANNPNTANNTASGANNTETGQGLPAQTQVQQAGNFIRYVTSAVNPLNLPLRTTYEKLLSDAINASGNTSKEAQETATRQLTNYFTKLRSYAAQSSVAISNLYYIMSRRLPQKPMTEKGSPSSNALNEFVLATWRLYNPSAANNSGKNSQQWLNKINKGSTATVQKEIAILLAEINYQLYLSRVQQERILLTESVLLMQSQTSMQPDAEMNGLSPGTMSPDEFAPKTPQ